MKTLVGGNKYLSNKVVPMYRFTDGNYVITQQVSGKDGMPVDKYIEFGGCCLAVVEKGYVIAKATKNINNDNVTIILYEIDDVDNVTLEKNTVYYKSRLIFEGGIDEFENRRTMRQYDKAVQFTVNNLYCLVPAYYINE